MPGLLREDHDGRWRNVPLTRPRDHSWPLLIGLAGTLSISLLLAYAILSTAMQPLTIERREIMAVQTVEVPLVVTVLTTMTPVPTSTPVPTPTAKPLPTSTPYGPTSNAPDIGDPWWRQGWTT